ncbi:MAG: apolipoprotein N-acyltransferase [Ilumatobacteraceae bacterium]
MLRRIIPSRRAVTALLGGVLVAAALPPWGIWPLAFLGVAVFETSVHAAEDGRSRFLRGLLFGIGWLAPGMVWMWFLTAPGYLLATLMFASFHGVAALVAPRGSWRVVGRPAAHTLAEALRMCFPFGGVPLATLAIGQADGPFIGVVRIGGVLLLTWFVFQIGFALAGPAPFVPQLARARRPGARGELHGALAFIVAMLVWTVSPLADATRATNEPLLRVAVVQGGGPQGTHAIDTPKREVFDRHMDATATIQPGTVDFVLWPENVIDVDSGFEGSDELRSVTEQAARLGVPFAVGITEDSADGDHFVNAQVIVTPDGEVYDRYEKVRRVPFGEYMPMRGLLRALGAPTNLVPRDAVAGTGPAVLRLPDGTTMAVVISWEVFFGGRANEGVEHGGTFIINPTNGSSYTWTVLQTQQIASSRLRAVEQGRWVAQAAPTGFSAFVGPDGQVYQRTSVSEQKVIIHPIERREGRTWYSRTGNLPWVGVMLMALGGSWWAFRKQRARESASADPAR